jgi:hypothetical protein
MAAAEQHASPGLPPYDEVKDKFWRVAFYNMNSNCALISFAYFVILTPTVTESLHRHFSQPDYVYPISYMQIRAERGMENLNRYFQGAVIDKKIETMVGVFYSAVCKALAENRTNGRILIDAMEMLNDLTLLSDEKRFYHKKAENGEQAGAFLKVLPFIERTIPDASIAQIRAEYTCISNHVYDGPNSDEYRQGVTRNFHYQWELPRVDGDKLTYARGIATMLTFTAARGGQLPIQASAEFFENFHLQGTFRDMFYLNRAIASPSCTIVCRTNGCMHRGIFRKCLLEEAGIFAVEVEAYGSPSTAREDMNRAWEKILRWETKPVLDIGDNAQWEDMYLSTIFIHTGGHYYMYHKSVKNQTEFMDEDQGVKTWSKCNDSRVDVRQYTLKMIAAELSREYTTRKGQQPDPEGWPKPTMLVFEKRSARLRLMGDDDVNFDLRGPDVDVNLNQDRYLPQEWYMIADNEIDNKHGINNGLEQLRSALTYAYWLTGMPYREASAMVRGEVAKGGGTFRGRLYKFRQLIEHFPQSDDIEIPGVLDAADRIRKALRLKLGDGVDMEAAVGRVNAIDSGDANKRLKYLSANYDVNDASLETQARLAGFDERDARDFQNGFPAPAAQRAAPRTAAGASHRRPPPNRSRVGTEDDADIQAAIVASLKAPNKPPRLTVTYSRAQEQAVQKSSKQPRFTGGGKLGSDESKQTSQAAQAQKDRLLAYELQKRWRDEEEDDDDVVQQVLPSRSQPRPLPPRFTAKPTQDYASILNDPEFQRLKPQVQESARQMIAANFDVPRIRGMIFTEKNFQ